MYRGAQVVKFDGYSRLVDCNNSFVIYLFIGKVGVKICNKEKKTADFQRFILANVM